ncbi:MAG: tetratricopeptide repeat protein [Nitrospinota bacterium]
MIKKIFLRRTVHSLVFTCLVFFPGPYSCLAGPEELYNSGNAAYSKGEYKKAFTLYSKAFMEGAEDPDLLFNLGNAAYKTGRPGLAILYYEKGLRLAPSDTKMRENLAFLKLGIKDKIDEPPKGVVTMFLAWCYSLLSLNGFFIVALFFYLILFFLLFLFILEKKNLSKSIVVTISFLVISTLFVSAKIYEEELTVSGIVLDKEVHARSEPKQDGDPVFTVHEGTSFEVKEEHGEWALITLATGWSGWVPRASIGII